MDRRTVWAILLMMLIAVVPALFLKRPAPSSSVNRAAAPRGAGTPSGPAHSPTGAPAPWAPLPSVESGAGLGQGAQGAAADTVWVVARLYRYAFSTGGGRMVGATLSDYPSMALGDNRRPVQIVPTNSELLDLTLVLGRDTVPLRDWAFTPSVD